MRCLSRLIHCAAPKEEDLAALTNVCNPATFGVDNKDVLDESYRKAGNLDANNFMWRFHPELSEFKRKVQKNLLPYHQEDRGIVFELYKLNVYGTSICFH